MFCKDIRLELPLTLFIKEGHKMPQEEYKYIPFDPPCKVWIQKGIKRVSINWLEQSVTLTYISEILSKERAKNTEEELPASPLFIEKVKEV